MFDAGRRWLALVATGWRAVSLLICAVTLLGVPVRYVRNLRGRFGVTPTALMYGDPCGDTRRAERWLALIATG